MLKLSMVFQKHCSSLEMKMAKKIEKSVNQDSTDYETCAVIWFGANVKLLPLLPLKQTLDVLEKMGLQICGLSKMTEPRKTRFSWRIKIFGWEPSFIN